MVRQEKSGGKTFVVAQYLPGNKQHVMLKILFNNKCLAGNYQGRFKKHVTPLKQGNEHYSSQSSDSGDHPEVILCCCSWLCCCGIKL